MESQGAAAGRDLNIKCVLHQRSLKLNKNLNES